MEERFMFRLTSGLRAELDYLAAENGISVTDLIRVFIIEGFIKHRNTKPKIIQGLSGRAIAIEKIESMRSVSRGDKQLDPEYKTPMHYDTTILEPENLVQLYEDNK
jgi:hypothetical protein